MQRPWCAALVVVGVGFLAIPLVAGHGAPTPRGIDTRIVLDDDGETGYYADACEGQTGVCPLASGAVDLLALDAREAVGTADAHVLWLRFVYQSTQSIPVGSTIEGRLGPADAPDQLTVTLVYDGASWTAGGFLMQGPFPVGDGHPQAVDVEIPVAPLGWTNGTQLSGITVVSRNQPGTGDVMPGTFDVQTVRFPGDTPAAATYTLQGPAALITADPTLPTMELANGTASASWVLRAGPSAPTQLVVLDSILDREPVSAILEPGGTLRVALAATTAGTYAVTARTDMGGFAQATWTVTAPPPPAPSPTPTSSTEDKTSPLPLVAAIALLAASAMRRE